MNRIIPPLKLPRQEQHDRVFLQDAIERYKNKLLTAAGYIFTIVKIYRQSGHRLNIPHPRSFYEHFQIPKSTFYRALIRLEKAEGVNFKWEPIGGISMWWEDGEAEVTAPIPEVTAPIPEVTAPIPDPQRWNQIPSNLRDDFEAFVRSQWRKIRNQEIRSFHRFVEKAADFKAWWEKFKARPIANIQFPITQPEPVAILADTAAVSKRMSADRIRELRQLIQSKK